MIEYNVTHEPCRHGHAPRFVSDNELTELKYRYRRRLLELEQERVALEKERQSIDLTPIAKEATLTEVSSAVSEQTETLSEVAENVAMLAKQGDNSEATNTAILAAIGALSEQVNASGNAGLTDISDEEIGDLFEEETEMKTINVTESSNNIHAQVLKYEYSEADNVKINKFAAIVDDEYFYAWKNEQATETLLYSIEKNPTAGTSLYTAEQVAAATNQPDPVESIQSRAIVAWVVGL